MCIYIYIHLTIYKYTVCQTALVNTKRAYNWMFTPSMMVAGFGFTHPHIEAPSIGRAVEGTALLERCLGCLAVGMTTGVPAAPRLIKLGLPAHGSVVARDQSFPAQGEPGIIWWDAAVLPGTVQKRTSRMWTRRQRRSTTAEVKNRILSIRMSSQYSLSRYICQANLSIVYSNSLILPE